MHNRKVSRVRLVGALACCIFIAAPLWAGHSDKSDKPSVAVRASPTAGFSPLRVVVSADLRGGADNYQDFYCAAIEWEWGDDTRAETSADCEPYEAAKSRIQRRYSVSRVFQTAGEYKVTFRLKQKDKVVGSGSTTVQVRPGIRDGMGCCDR